MLEPGSVTLGPPNVLTREAIVARVARDASMLYGDTIAAETLADWASSAVAELWGDSVKVTSFLQVLALRMVSNQAESVAGQMGADLN